MSSFYGALKSLNRFLHQITVTLQPNQKICDDTITTERWIAFLVSVTGALLFLTLLWINSATEAGLTTLSRQRLQAMRDRHERRAHIVEELLNRPAQVTSTLNLIHIICLVGATALAISSIHQFNLYGPEVTIMVIVLTFVTLSLARTLPKGIALNQPEGVTLRFSGFINAEVTLTKPLVWLVNAVANLFLRLLKLKPLPANTVVSEEEISLLANIGEEEGLIEEEEREMIRSIFQFGGTLVREVMIPRLDIKALAITASLNEALDTIISSGKSRLPVYQPDIDHILGILYAKDLLRILRQPVDTTAFDLQSLLRPAYYVPESKKVDQLFTELQNQRVHIAIVVDEYGGTAGLVTIEDLLEEIVGEIQDEYDVETPSFERISPDEVWLDARLNLDEVNEFFNTKWESEDIETIGGFVYDKLGRIPVERDALVVDQMGRLLHVKEDGSTVLDRKEATGEDIEPSTDYYRISVLRINGQRLRQLRLQHVRAAPLPAATATEESEAETRTETKETRRKRQPRSDEPDSPTVPGNHQPLSE
jgi:putative hemolysin